MKQAEWEVYARRFLDQMYATLCAKGRDYNDGTDDRLQNFKTIAARTGTTPQQALQVLVSKHLDAIERHCRGHKCTTEPVYGRLIDACNYFVLLAALEEDENAGTGT